MVVPQAGCHEGILKALEAPVGAFADDFIRVLREGSAKECQVREGEVPLGGSSCNLPRAASFSVTRCRIPSNVKKTFLNQLGGRGAAP